MVKGSGGVTCPISNHLQDQTSIVFFDISSRFLWFHIYSVALCLKDTFIAISYLPLAPSLYAVQNGLDDDPYIDLLDNISFLWLGILSFLEISKHKPLLFETHLQLGFRY